MDHYKGIMGNAPKVLQFFLLMALVIIGMIVAAVASVIAVLIMNDGHTSLIQSLTMQGGGLRNLIVMQMLSQIFTFILPPLCFSYLVTGSPFSYFQKVDKGNVNKYILGAAIIFLAGFFLQFLIIDKATFVFPDGLKWLETISMKTQNTYDSFINQLTGVKGVFKISVIFIMIAVFPAIGEELLFRGVLQKNIEEWTKSRGPAILISGILFGLMHMEFFNFFALCFMGFVLGWIYSVTKNIWLTIFLHFVNNAVSFFALYTYQNGTSKINPEEKLPFYIPLSAGIVMVALMYLLNRYSKVREDKSVLNNEPKETGMTDSSI